MLCTSALKWRIQNLKSFQVLYWKSYFQMLNILRPDELASAARTCRRILEAYHKLLVVAFPEPHKLWNATNQYMLKLYELDAGAQEAITLSLRVLPGFTSVAPIPETKEERSMYTVSTCEYAC